MEVLGHANLMPAEPFIHEHSDDPLFEFYTDDFSEKVQMCSSWFEILELRNDGGFYLWYYLIRPPLFYITPDEIEGEL
jgi:hypothetical protein